MVEVVMITRALRNVWTICFRSGFVVVVVVVAVEAAYFVYR